MVERHMIDALLGVIECRMALAERAAAAVLSGQANGSAFDEERSESERFAKRPVVGSALAQDLEPSVDEHAADFG